MKFVFVTDFFESSALALWLKIQEKKDISVVILEKDYDKILEGFIDKEHDFVKYMGERNIFVTDNASLGKLADSLRKKGELVFGGSEISDKLENDRSFGQKAMQSVGINIVKSYNFKGVESFNQAIEFIKKNPKRWVIKQNGDLSKSLSTVGKFENGEDIIDKLDDFKRSWIEKIDFDLQEFVDGHEAGVSAWFNGNDFLRDKNGEIVFELNWEHKKKSEGDTGSTTGETCTLAYRATKDSRLAKELLKTKPLLQRIKYLGNVDINFIIDKKKDIAYGLEWSNRFGYPSLNLQQEMMKNSWSDLIEGVVKRKNNFLQYDPRWSVVVVLQVPPFPFESIKDENNAKGQRVYFIEKGKWTGKDSLTVEKLKHIHLHEIKFDKETKEFLCSGNTGYILTVSGQNQTDFKDWKKGISDVNEKTLNYLKENVYTSNMDYRKDCGINKRVIDAIEYMISKMWI